MSYPPAYDFVLSNAFFLSRKKACVFYFGSPCSNSVTEKERRKKERPQGEMLLKHLEYLFPAFNHCVTLTHCRIMGMPVHFSELIGPSKCVNSRNVITSPHVDKWKKLINYKASLNDVSRCCFNHGQLLTRPMVPDGVHSQVFYSGPSCCEWSYCIVDSISVASF